MSATSNDRHWLKLITQVDPVGLLAINDTQKRDPSQHF